jgi:hypothetical protein
MRAMSYGVAAYLDDLRERGGGRREWGLERGGGGSEASGRARIK